MSINRAKRPVLYLSMLVWLTSAASLIAQSPSIPLDHGLLLPKVARGGRVPVPTDAYAPQLLADPMRMAEEGESVTRPDGTEAVWEMVDANEDGEFDARAISGGYLQFKVELEKAGVYLLEAQGHGSAIINGRRRTGNPYRSWYRAPVALRAGANQILIRPARGFRGKLVPTTQRALIGIGEATLPDWRIGMTEPIWGAVPVLNCQDTNADNWRLVCTVEGADPQSVDCQRLHATSLRKVPFLIKAPEDAKPGKLKARLELFDGESSLAQTEFEVDVRRSNETYKVTFRSRIDDSVQYFGVVPQQLDAGTSVPENPPALILSLHGASVEGIGQARVYAQRNNAIVVAPTNRRPFGFDWEDWGRIDALEVLDLAQERFGTDPLRTYLTGHSMGGHGTWNVGVNFPDRFAAIGPSAGWISFRSYAAARRPEQNRLSDDDDFAAKVSDMFERAVATSDTLALSSNYATHGIYILHGDADRNVPVTEARTMRTHLAKWHPDFAYYEQPGAGHWWGNQCCDWPPMLAFFDHHKRRASENVDSVDFTTANSGVSSQFAWAAVHRQQTPGRLSKIELKLDREARRFEGTTENVETLLLDLKKAGISGGGPVQISIDATELETDNDEVWLQRTEQGVWQTTSKPGKSRKHPQRYGFFKAAFDNDVQLVYGTGGTEAEQTWARNKALYDAEQFWYRGNGALDVVADVDFDPSTDVDRNVVLYGHAGMNRAWAKLLPDCPLKVDAGKLEIGTHSWQANDLAALAIYPRPGSDYASIGIVAGTTATGAGITDTLPYFVSGVGYPDYIVLDAKCQLRGTRGVVAAGFWDADWQVSDDAVFAKSKDSP